MWISFISPSLAENTEGASKIYVNTSNIIDTRMEDEMVSN
jgi:hypothetical protein